jgi:16S rRNA (cytosine967-C5)-methyltransferase
MLRPVPGERILDACSAPGGKSCHLLEHVPGLDLLALDRDQSRLRLVAENLERLHLNCTLMQADAGEPSAWWDGVPFDKILLDAPCSTTGVIRRHPEIKHLRSPQQVENAVADQRRLLDALWPLLKADGILVYATCSILKCENHQQIHEFLSRHPDASPVDREGNQMDTATVGFQILPGQQGMDGFFYAIVHKSA